MAVGSSAAKKVADNILSRYKGILGISLMDMKGNILAANAKEAYIEAFGAGQDRAAFGGRLAVQVLSLVNQVTNIFGRTVTIITIHENSKLLLLPLTPFQILVGVVLERSVNAEDHAIVKDIEILVADALIDETR